MNCIDLLESDADGDLVDLATHEVGWAIKAVAVDHDVALALETPAICRKRLVSEEEVWMRVELEEQREGGGEDSCMTYASPSWW